MSHSIHVCSASHCAWQRRFPGTSCLLVFAPELLLCALHYVNFVLVIRLLLSVRIASSIARCRCGSGYSYACLDVAWYVSVCVVCCAKTDNRSRYVLGEGQTRVGPSNHQSDEYIVGTT